MTNPPAAEVEKALAVPGDEFFEHMFQKLAEVLTAEDELHPIGCAAWEEVARAGIDDVQFVIPILRSALTASEARADAAEMRVREAKSLLERILKYGEIGVVSISGFFNGLKPPSKEVWQVPRHMHADIEEILAALAPAPGEAG